MQTDKQTEQWPGQRKYSAGLIPASVASDSPNQSNETREAYFERFTLEMPLDAVADCAHQGACDDDVEHWASKLTRPEQCTPESLRDELREYGAWDSQELSDDDMNWRRIIWIAATNIKEENARSETSD